MPVFLHNREAFKDFYSILKKYFSNLPGGIVHCFTGSKSELVSFLDLGCTLESLDGFAMNAEEQT